MLCGPSEDYDRDAQIIQFRSDNDMPTLRQLIQKLTYNLHETATYSKNTFINTLSRYDPKLKLTLMAAIY